MLNGPLPLTKEKPTNRTPTGRCQPGSNELIVTLSFAPGQRLVMNGKMELDLIKRTGRKCFSRGVS